MTIFYRLGQKLYVNITNACPCACDFCIRNTADGVGDADSLWLEREPTIPEIKDAYISRRDLASVDEIVFCGYGEPMERANDVILLCKFFKANSPTMPVRINTNGLVTLLHPDFNMEEIAIVDSISVSLNADTAEEYVRIVNPRFGIKAYAAMLDFVAWAKDYTNVTLTVVNTLAPERIDNCRKIAANLGLPLVVRETM